MEAARTDSLETEGIGWIWIDGCERVHHLQSSDTAIVNHFFSPKEWARGGGARRGVQGSNTNQDFTIKANTSN